MVNVVLFPGNIKFNHSVGVANVIYCNGRVRVAGIMVKIVLNIPQSLREIDRSIFPVVPLSIVYP